MNEGNLRNILSRLGIPDPLLNSSGWLVASCPFAEFLHDRGKDRRPSFFIHVNDGGVSGFNCYSCHQTGTVGGLVRKLAHYRGEDYTGLVLDAECFETPETWGDYEQRETVVLAEPIPDGDLLLGSYPEAWESERCREYLEGRGVSEKTAGALRLLYDPDAVRVVFPVLDQEGNLYGMTGRSILPDARVKVKDYMGLKKSQLLLGEHLVPNESGLSGVVVEGLFALAHMIELRLPPPFYAVATMGASMSEFQRDRLVDLFDKVYLLYDDDAAGDDGLYGRRRRNGQHEGGGAVDLCRGELPTYVPYYPARTSDPDELTRAELRDMIEGAGFMP